MKLAKFLSLAALSISISSLFLSPVSANPPGENNWNRMGENLIASAKTQLGRVIETSGSTVTVLFRDGSTKVFQVSEEQIKQMNLAEDKYVTVSEEEIIDVVKFGKVVAVVGDILTYKLQEGSVGTVALSSQNSVDTLDLKEGTYIYLSNGQIIAVSYTEEAEIIKRSAQNRTATLGEQNTQRVQETYVREVRTVPAPVREVVEPAVTEQVITKPAVIKKPIRGMW